MNFEFHTTTKIVFGTGSFSHLDDFLEGLGDRVFIVTGSSGRYSKELKEILFGKDFDCYFFPIAQEPTIEIVRKGVHFARKFQCNFVIGLGGGSVIDTAKAIAVLLTNEGDILDYLEVVGRGKKISRASLPCIAIPTTSGTGSEVTINSVIGVPEQKVKVSLRSQYLAPHLAIVDSELACSMTPEVTAFTGMDTLTQLIEPYTSKMFNPLIDPLCMEGIHRVARALLRAYHHGNDLTAREDMAFASLIGGLALANAKLGAVHGFAGPIGGIYYAPHGAICARLLPFVMEKNIYALSARGDDLGILDRYKVIDQILTHKEYAKALDGITWVKELIEGLNIPSLSKYGIREEDFPEIIEKASKASSMRGNPIELTKEEMGEILMEATY